MQALVSVPKLRDFCLEPAGSHQLRKGPIGSALQELVQTVYGARTTSHAHFCCRTAAETQAHTLRHFSMIGDSSLLNDHYSCSVFASKGPALS